MDTNQDGRIDSNDLHNALAKVSAEGRTGRYNPGVSAKLLLSLLSPLLLLLVQLS